MKRPVIIHKAAQIRLAEIWDYTLEKWGEEQADRYLRELGIGIDGISDRENLPLWRSVKDKRLPDVFFLRSGHHFIFFREIQEQIALISVLHESMDMVQRLKGDSAGS